MLKSSIQKSISAWQLLLYSVVLGILLSTFIFGATDLFSVNLSKPVPVYPTLLVVCSFLSICAALYAFVVDAALDDKTLAIPIGCLSAAAICIIELGVVQGSFSPKTYFHLTFLCNAVLVYCTTRVLTQALQMHSHWPSSVAIGVTVALSLVGAVCLIFQNWIDLAHSALYLTIVRSALIASLPIIAVILYLSVKSLHIHALYLRKSLKLSASESPQSKFAIGGGVSISLFAAMICTAAVVVLNKKLFDIPISALTSIVPLAFWHTFRRARIGLSERSQQTASAALAPLAAKRFMRRHMPFSKHLAASSGIRTPSFIIDHDPAGMVNSSLPAAIMQIRNAEIERCVTQLLDPMYLYQSVVGSQIYGTIDSELSCRPCTDVLLLFAGLHMDAVQLVERRLTGLVDLLPILDPDLSNNIDAKDIDKLLTRDLWLYHFDYTWADQQLVKTKQGVQYAMNSHLAPSALRIRVFEYLKEHNRIGNFIWVGDAARERLLQEAPMLAPIIQAWPVPVGNNEEQIVFLIKYEELIPRLQKYFGLEEKRHALQDYEPSAESTRFLSVIDLQLQNSNDLHSLYQVIMSLASFPWRGFREKDRALQAVKRTYLQAVTVLAEMSLAPDEFNRQRDAVRVKFIKATSQIGYPSQTLHRAHLNKMAMRDTSRTIRNASQPWHPRFHESWLLISSSDFARASSAQVKAYLEFLRSVPDSKQLSTEPFVQIKAIEALVNLSVKSKPTTHPLYKEILVRYGKWLIASKASADLCVLYIDALQFMETHLGDIVSLPAESIEEWNGYIHKLARKYGKSSHRMQAIYSRWHRHVPDKLRAVS